MDRPTLLTLMRMLRLRGLGPVLMNRLLREIGPPETILASSREKLRAIPGIGPRLVEEIQRLARSGEKGEEEHHARQELERLEVFGVHTLAPMDPRYPPLLARIHDPPPLLHVLGDRGWLGGENLIAVVGSRRPSRRGAEIAYRLGRELAQAGCVVVSGLAQGIDSAAHQGALDGGGATVAVVATGLDVIYPPQNKPLRERILGRGCLVGESALGTPPHPSLFPPRNRIISGLSVGVVVVEAAERSGSLVTARMALEQGREVFAVPGPAGDDRARGSNALLRDGAGWAESAQDVLEAFAWGRPPAAPAAPPSSAPGILVPRPANLPPELDQLLTELEQGPTLGDELARRCRLTVGDLSRILLQLEMIGVVERLPGNLYTLRPPLGRSLG